MSLQLIHWQWLHHHFNLIATRLQQSNRKGAKSQMNHCVTSAFVCEELLFFFSCWILEFIFLLQIISVLLPPHNGHWSDERCGEYFFDDTHLWHILSLIIFFIQWWNSTNHNIPRYFHAFFFLSLLFPVYALLWTHGTHEIAPKTRVHVYADTKNVEMSRNEWKQDHPPKGIKWPSIQFIWMIWKITTFECLSGKKI